MAVSVSEVIAAYRLILGREPENEGVVRENLAHESVGELRATFLASEEFRWHSNSMKPLNLPPLEIETVAPESVLKKMIARVESTFRDLGETEPHWSILPYEKFKAENIAKHEEEFYGSGWGKVVNFRTTAKRCGIELGSYKRCLELGCGLGRSTRWLSEIFDTVIAVDVSVPHLTVARETMKRFARDNVQFVHFDRLGFLDDLPDLDVFFSIIVLQHNPPPIIVSVLEKILGRLRRGGIAYFQVPTYAPGYAFNAAAYLERPEWKGAGVRVGGDNRDPEMHVVPQHVLYDLIDAMGCRLLEVREDDAAGLGGFVSNRLLVQKRQ
jgi:SAM-dependent methyltransferase